MTIKLVTKGLSWTLQVTLSFLTLRFLMVLVMREAETNQILKFAFLWDMTPRHWVIGSRGFETTQWSDFLQSKRLSFESLKPRILDYFV
jgi:hypothetical protein